MTAKSPLTSVLITDKVRQGNFEPSLYFKGSEIADILEEKIKKCDKKGAINAYLELKEECQEIIAELRGKQ